jgi:TRAP-type C4-dicarboxylate transport system substrate-binding protein
MKSMRKMLFATIALLLTVSLVLAGCGSSGSGGGSSSSGGGGGTSSGSSGGSSGGNEKPVDPITLRYATYLSQNHYMAELNRKMFRAIEEKTGGKVKFEEYYDATLVQPREWYQELQQGTADLADAQTGTERDRFSLEYSLALFNYGITDLKELLEFTREMRQLPEIQALYQDVHPTHSMTAGLSYVHMAKKPIRSAADFKGLNLKVADDASTALVKALGANPVQVPIAETYTALEKGTIDGVVTGGDPLLTFKFAEVVKYTTRLPYATPWINNQYMTKETWNSLPDDVKQAFLEEGPKWEEGLIEEMAKLVADAEEFARQHNVEIIDLDPAAAKEILDVMEQNALAHAKELDDKGQPGTFLFEKARELAQKYMK